MPTGASDPRRRDLVSDILLGLAALIVVALVVLAAWALATL